MFRKKDKELSIKVPKIKQNNKNGFLSFLFGNKKSPSGNNGKESDFGRYVIIILFILIFLYVISGGISQVKFIKEIAEILRAVGTIFAKIFTDIFKGLQFNSDGLYIK